jgi:hypothetical protein
VLAAAVSLAGCGGSSGVTAKVYAGRICAALGRWDRAIITRTEQLAADRPRHLSAAHGQALAVGYLGGLLADTESAATAIHGAGTPAITNGTSVASTLTGAFQDAVTVFRTAHDRIAALSSHDRTALRNAARNLGQETDDSLSAVGRSVHQGPCLSARLRVHHGDGLHAAPERRDVSLTGPTAIWGTVSCPCSGSCPHR